MELPRDSANTIADAEDTIQPELTLITGGLATEQAVEIVRVREPRAAEVIASLEKDRYDLMSADELMEKRRLLSEQRGVLALRIHELQQEYDEIHREMLWVNGFIRDRQ